MSDQIEIYGERPLPQRLEVDFVPSMDMGGFKAAITRLYTGFARPVPEPAVRLLWLERLSANQVDGELWLDAVNWFLDNGERLPTLPLALGKAKSIRESRLVLKRQQERSQALSAARSAGEGLSQADEYYEEHRQRLKKRQGTGYESAEKLQRYGPEIAGDSTRPTAGPVLLPDGSPDPEWPELEGREPAWRRRGLYEMGIWSLAQAQAPTTRQAKMASGVPQAHGRGPRKMF